MERQLEATRCPTPTPASEEGTKAHFEPIMIGEGAAERYGDVPVVTRAADRRHGKTTETC
jgi:hypothetical protein